MILHNVSSHFFFNYFFLFIHSTFLSFYHLFTSFFFLFSSLLISLLSSSSFILFSLYLPFFYSFLLYFFLFSFLWLCSWILTCVSHCPTQSYCWTRLLLLNWINSKDILLFSPLLCWTAACRPFISKWLIKVMFVLLLSISLFNLFFITIIYDFFSINFISIWHICLFIFCSLFNHLSIF